MSDVDQKLMDSSASRSRMQPATFRRIHFWTKVRRDRAYVLDSRSFKDAGTPD